MTLNEHCTGTGHHSLTLYMIREEVKSTNHLRIFFDDGFERQKIKRVFISYPLSPLPMIDVNRKDKQEKKSSRRSTLTMVINNVDINSCRRSWSKA